MAGFEVTPERRTNGGDPVIAMTLARIVSGAVQLFCLTLFLLMPVFQNRAGALVHFIRL